MWLSGSKRSGCSLAMMDVDSVLPPRAPAGYIAAGVSQAWMLSSGLPPEVTAQGHSNSWYGLQGLASLTALDLGGSHFSNAVWVRHMCPLLTSCSNLQRLMLAHCSIPPGKMQHLLPGLSSRMVELNIDRWGQEGGHACSDAQQAVRLGHSVDAMQCRLCHFWAKSAVRPSPWGLTILQGRPEYAASCLADMWCAVCCAGGPRVIQVSCGWRGVAGLGPPDLPDQAVGMCDDPRAGQQAGSTAHTPDQPAAPGERAVSQCCCCWGCGKPLQEDTTLLAAQAGVLT